MANTEPKLSLADKQSIVAHALGHAVTRWVGVEFGLVSIFATATGMSPTTAASILRPVKTFSLLLDMTHAAVRCRLVGEPSLVYWNSLVEYARELSGDRNYMAHHALILHSPGPPESTSPDLVTPKIGPSPLAAMAGEHNDRQPLDAKEVTELLADFQELVEFLMAFNDALQSGHTYQQKFLEPAVRRRRPRKQRLEATRQSRSNPPESSQA